MKSRISWSNGGPGALIARMDQIPRELKQEAAEALQETVKEGAELQARILDESVTPYGQARFDAGRGNSAGRNDSGNMIAKIDTGVEETDDSLIGWWGWDNLDPHDGEYIEIQEATANSLAQSFIPTREALYGRVRAILKGR